MRIQGALVLGLMGLSSTAFALNQSKHYDVTVASCGAAGLPDAFCRRVGTEVYDVDAREFDDLSAHSQIPNGATACDAANASLWRVFWLGQEVRQSAQAVGAGATEDNVDALANWLGRALHTVQDNCAHHGMPNPQHAWHSLSDVCNGTTESPDLDPGAFACAAEETDAIFAAFVDVLHDGGGSVSELAVASTSNDKDWPAYGDVCAFLGSAGDWDGQDRRWNNDVMRPALTERFVAAIDGADSSAFQRVCTGEDDDVLNNHSDPSYDVSGGAQSCIKIHAFCLGKADGAAAEPPPWETAAPTTSSTVQGGCSFMPAAAPSSSPMAALLLVVGLTPLLVSRRRRPRR